MSKEIGPRILGNWEWRHSPETQTTVYGSADLFLVSFWGGENRGRCLQLTIVQDSGGQTAYIQLNAFSVRELLERLTAWDEETRKKAATELGKMEG